jgi:hypothetical protein
LAGKNISGEEYKHWHPPPIRCFFSHGNNEKHPRHFLDVCSENPWFTTNSQTPFGELFPSPFASQPENSPINTEVLSMHLSPAQRRIEGIMEGQGTGISKHLDDLLMGEVVDEKNTFGVLQEIMGEIHKLSNNRERRETAFRGLHYLHQTLLELMQREHKGPAGTDGINSLSDVTSGN